MASPSVRVGDITIYAKDVDTLRPRAWLNDQVIAYALESLNASAPAGVLCLEPSTVFMSAMISDPKQLAEMLSVPRNAGASTVADALASATRVIMPINDNDDSEALEGGGHWSLLCYQRHGTDGGGPRFEHFDSCGGANGARAKSVALCFMSLLEPNDRAPKLQLVNMKMAQQMNGYDCDSLPPQTSRLTVSYSTRPVLKSRALTMSAFGSLRRQAASTQSLSPSFSPLHPRAPPQRYGS